MEVSDWELIERYRGQGDKSCLDELVCRHLPKTRALIQPMVGQAALADDLTQETFFRAIRSLASFQGKSQFGTWLARIAVNIVREYHRKSLRRPEISHNNIHEVFTEDNSPELRSRNAEMADDIHLALLELPEPWREAVTLVCIQGYSTVEAAQICSCTVATLYWRIHQSRKRLKQRLADYL